MIAASNLVAVGAPIAVIILAHRHGLSSAAIGYTLIPDRLLGRAMAASNTLRAASAPLGPPVTGLLLAHASPRVAIAAIAAPVVAAAALGTASRALRDLPSLSASPAGAG